MSSGPLLAHGSRPGVPSRALPDGFEPVQERALGQHEIYVLLGDYLVLEIVVECTAKLGGPLSGACEDQTLHTLMEGDFPGELPRFLEESVDVGLRPAAGRLEIRPVSGIRLAWKDVHLPEAVGLDLTALVGAHQWRDHEVTEPIGVEDRRPVRFVLVQDERQRGHVRVAPPVRLGNVNMQPVDFQEIIRRQDGERPGVSVLQADQVRG